MTRGNDGERWLCESVRWMVPSALKSAASISPAQSIDGMPDDEAQELIDYLKDFATRPEFVYRHKWRVDEALLWDNRRTQHCATPFDDATYRRLMQRTTLEGEVPIMAEREVVRPAPALV